MPSMGDSIFIFLLALMLFGPKKLPQLARQLGKLMAEFRKASNDFRMQMEDELRIEEQKEHQAKVNALTPPPSSTPNPDIPTEEPPHPHLPAAVAETSDATALQPSEVQPTEPQPIAQSGDLKMMPPSSGLPMESSARGKSFSNGNGLPHADTASNPAESTPAQTGTSLPDVPEYSIGGGAFGSASAGVGASSEEPVAELEPPPDRGHPVMAGEGERATHV